MSEAFTLQSISQQGPLKISQHLHPQCSCYAATLAQFVLLSQGTRILIRKHALELPSKAPPWRLIRVGTWLGDQMIKWSKLLQLLKSGFPLTFRIGISTTTTGPLIQSLITPYLLPEVPLAAAADWHQPDCKIGCHYLTQFERVGWNLRFESTQMLEVQTAGWPPRTCYKCEWVCSEV